MVSVSQHGESNGRDSLTVQRPIVIVQWKTIGAVTVHRPLKRQKERKKSGAAGDRTQGLWLKPPALCHWAGGLSQRHYWSSNCRGVPSIGLPMLWLRSTSIMMQSNTLWCIQYILQQSLKSRAIKGKGKGVAVGGCRSSECWWLKPEAVGSIPGGATFLSFSSPSFIRQSLSVFGLWRSLVHRTPHAVITLTIHYDQHNT